MLRGSSFIAALLLGLAPAVFADAPPIELPSIPDRTFTITDYGAVADGQTPAADALTRAVAAARQAGGGIVRVPEGRYLTGPFVLASRINLHLDKGAVLLLINSFDAYPKNEKTYLDGITAHDCTDIAITGEGTIDGQGQPWWDKYRKRNGVVPKGLLHRPYMIRLSDCTRVLVKDVTLTNSPSFHLVPDDCDDVTIDHVTIKAPADYTNTDAIDPSGWNYHISNCTLDIGDDNIAIKAHKSRHADRPCCGNFLVEHCTFLHGHGMSIGGQTPGGLRGLLVRDCTFTDTDAGIRLKAGRGEGGLVEDCTYERLTMRNVKVPVYITSYYPSLPADVESDPAQPVNATTPIWRNIRVSDVTATDSPEAGRIIGLPEMPVSDVVFTNVHISASKGMRIVRAKEIQFVKSSITAAKAPAVSLHEATATGIDPQTGK